MPPRRSRRLPRPVPLLVSLVVATAFVVPLAIVVVPRWDTARQLHRITSSDPGVRDRALARLVHRAADHPPLVRDVAARFADLPPDSVLPAYAAFSALDGEPVSPLTDAAVTALPRLGHADFTGLVRLLERRGQARRPAVTADAARRLDDADDTRFAELYLLLERLGGWARPPVSDDAWLRWIAAALGPDGTPVQPGVAPFVADRLADVPDLAADPRATTMVDRLLHADAPADRLAALPLAAGFVPLDPAYAPLVRGLLDDPDADVADAAERIVSLLDAPPPPDPPQPRMSIRRLRAPGDATHSADSPDSADGLTSAAPSDITPDNIVAVWRRVLSLPESPAAVAWWRDLAAMDLDDLLRRPVALAATYRLGSRALPPYSDDPGSLSEHRWKAVLAALEGAAPGSLELTVPDGMPHVVRPAALRAAREPDPAWLLDTLRLNDRPAARDVACVAAAETLGDEKLDTLIETLLVDPDPEGRISAAVLVGLTGRRIDLLQKWSGREQRQAVAVMMRVGLWMAGEDEAFGDTLPSMLGRAGLPDTTLMLAMLNGPPPGSERADRLAAVLERLNAMPVDGRLDLLGTRRWWAVLAPHLPASAPALSLWADGTLAREQLALLEAWSWLHRYDRTEGAEGPRGQGAE